MNRPTAMLFTVALLVFGCAAPPTKKPSPQPVVRIVPDERLHGRIATINSPGQFAVLDFNVGRIPPLRSELNVYRGNEVVGVVRLTGPARDNLVAADIVDGELAVGDRAIWDQKRPDQKGEADGQP
jgi:hypothetical protein